MHPGKSVCYWWMQELTAIKFILGILEHDPDLYLDEIMKQLHLMHGLNISLPTVWWALTALGLSQKKMSVIALLVLNNVF
jgi:hypothetical protein